MSWPDNNRSRSSSGFPASATSGSSAGGATAAGAPVYVDYAHKPEALQGTLTAKEVNHILKMKGLEHEFPFFTTVYKISYEGAPFSGREHGREDAQAGGLAGAVGA